MPKTIAILAPGAMGSAVARRLSEHGARVLTSLKGRSEATRKRAADAGMVGAEEDAIADADIILSIVPPSEAVALAEWLAALIVRREKKPVVIDCNAVNVDTVQRIEEIIGSAQAPFVDAGIIGFPPQRGGKSPAFYISGEYARDVAVLGDLGLDVLRARRAIPATGGSRPRRGHAAPLAALWSRSLSAQLRCNNLPEPCRRPASNTCSPRSWL